jgi:photosystem II stability/assembly factor-like uncharacterized protein
MKNIYIFCILLVILSINNFGQDYQDWKFTHPRPQANNLRKIQMVDLNTWIAVGANGTFMKTSNGGYDWYFHHQAGRYANAAQAIGQNYDLWFFDANNGFVVGDRGYIGKTVDGGVTFDSVGIGMVPVSQRCQAIWFANQDTGFVVAGSASGSAGTIVRTIDGGINWSSVLTYSSSFLSICGTTSTTFYAVAANGTIYNTTNAGLNWTANNAAVSQYMYSINFLDQNTGFVAGGDGYMSRTTDAGVTWNLLTSPQNNTAFFQVKIISATEIYAVGDPAFIYRSSDLGNSWTSLQIMPVSGPASTYIWYSMDKVGNNIILSGDYGVVAVSTNNGLTWSSNQFSLTTQILFDINQVPGTNKIFAVGRQYSSGTRQLFVSTDNGSDWTAQDLGVDFDASAISMVNSQVGYISGTNCQVLKTTDGGATWFQVTQPIAGTYNIYSMEFVNPDTGWVFVNYVTITNGNIFKTTDGGNSWTQQANGLSNSINSADMVDANIGFHTINSSNQPIFKTTNGGLFWLPITTPLTGIINTIKAVDANTIYIGASGGTNRMAKTTNGGTTWSTITLPVTVDVKSLDFMDADTGYVCGNLTTVVCRTTNGGNNWSFQNLHLPTLVKVAVLQNDIAFALGTYGSILRSDLHGFVPVEMTSFTTSVSGNNVALKWVTATELNNQGFEIERCSSTSEWQKIGFVEGSGTTSEPQSYSFIDRDLETGNYMYRLRQIDYDGTFEYSEAIEVEITIPFQFALGQNYPNPFNPSTVIEFSLPEDVNNVQLSIYNALGEKVAELVNSALTAGRYSYQWNAQNVATGMYIYKLQTDKFVSVKKMILMK